ncbi:MAG: V-type ATP synthase subunit E family protein [Thaumarchaeota archaeon]|nr:V-type ATP synthase subunit E family protein [Candidatus Calditenuaceae archaeon]MCX8203172.1 V-type ATP synthase subunit E family protein [Nitrososphaeria archaeon]MDW8042961.1 V-type ATP synthase subunit E family protein [Nitrososphaerota archaeon]
MSAPVTLERLIEEVVSEALIVYESKLDEAGKRVLERLEREGARLLEELRSEMERVIREVESERMRRTGQLELEARRAYLEEMERMVDAAIRDAVERVKSMRGSKEYREFLRRSLSDAVEYLGTEEVVVETCAEDMEAVRSIAKELSKERGVKVNVSVRPIPVIGGVRASRPDGSMVIDSTLDYRLKRAEEQLRSIVVRALTGQ